MRRDREPEMNSGPTADSTRIVQKGEARFIKAALSPSRDAGEMAMYEKIDLNSRKGKQFKELDRGWVAAYLQGNPELFSRIWAEGFIFTFPFAQFNNKEQELADLKSGQLILESLSTANVTLKLYGKTVVMAGRFTMKGEYRGRNISGEYDYTNVLEKELGNRWQIVASHAAMV